MDSFPELYTTRLILRQISQNDIDKLFELRTDIIVNKYINRIAPERTSELKDLINKLAISYQSGASFFWVIERLKTKGLVGTICLWNFVNNGKSCEIGYELHPHHQKQAIMTESLEAVLSFAEKLPRLLSIMAYTHQKNKASLNLLLKNGFRLMPDQKDHADPQNVIYQIRLNKSI